MLIFLYFICSACIFEAVNHFYERVCFGGLRLLSVSAQYCHVFMNPCEKNYVKKFIGIESVNKELVLLHPDRPLISFKGILKGLI